MEMQKHSGKLPTIKRFSPDLSPSVKAERASAAMYDTLTSSSLQFLDMAIDNSISNAEKSAIEEGSRLGMEAGRLQEDGSFTGFEPTTEIFKWDVAQNKAATAEFEATVANRAMSFVRKVATDADGDEAEFKRVSEMLTGESMNGLTNESQRDFTRSAFTKAYYQVLPTVRSRSKEKNTKKAVDTWKSARKIFRNDIGSTMRLYFKAKDDYAQAEVDNDEAGMKKASLEMVRQEVRVRVLREQRLRAAEGGIQLGALNPDGVYVDVEDDIFAGRKDATIEMVRSTEDYQEKLQIREQIASSTELGPMRITEMLKAIDEEIALENTQLSTDYSRMVRERNELTRNANNVLRGGILDLWSGKDTMGPSEFRDWQREIEGNINEFYSSGYLNDTERKNYLTMLRNGDQVSEDDASVYAEFYDNMEMYTIDDITSNGYLTFQTKKELTKRWVDFYQNEQWMKTPAYREGKTRIREAFGFYENTLLPQMLDPTRERQQKEMSNMIDAYRTEVRDRMSNGLAVNHFEIVSGLLDKAYKNEYSSINKGNKPFSGVVKYDYEIKMDSTDKGASFEQLVSDFEAMGGTVEKTKSGKKDIQLLSEKEKK